MEPGRHAHRVSAWRRAALLRLQPEQARGRAVRGRRAARAHRIARSIGVVTRVVAGRQEPVVSRRGRPRPVRRARAGRRRRHRAAHERPPRRAGSIDRTRRKAAVLAATAAEPFEVHALDGGQLRRLSAQNDEWLKPVQLAQRRRLHRTGEGRHGRERAPVQAAVLRGRHQIPDAAQHPRRPERAGRTRVRLRAPSGSRPTATSCCRSTIAAAPGEGRNTRRPSSPTGATRRSSTCSPASTTRLRRASPTPTASASEGGATAAS